MTTYTTPSQALISLADLINKDGAVISSRGGGWVKEITDNFFTLTHPLHRHLLVKNRFNNPFAAMWETLWVFSGHNDIKTLSYFLPRAKDFSDDGETWRAGYGPRLRNWHGVDQVQAVIQTLQEDITSRRAVINIFDPSVDHNQDTKDIPCNNWLSFRVRQGLLDMTIAVRSNDLVWGWSGINQFEWSFLQEYIATKLGIQVGTQSWVQGSLHMYDTYVEKFETKPYLPLTEGIDSSEIPTLSDSFPLFPHTIFTDVEFVDIFLENIIHLMDTPITLLPVRNRLDSVLDVWMYAFQLKAFAFHNPTEVDQVKTAWFDFTSDPRIKGTDFDLAITNYFQRTLKW